MLDWLLENICKIFVFSEILMVCVCAETINIERVCTCNFVKNAVFMGVYIIFVLINVTNNTSENLNNNVEITGW